MVRTSPYVLIHSGGPAQRSLHQSTDRKMRLREFWYEELRFCLLISLLLCCAKKLIENEKVENKFKSFEIFNKICQKCLIHEMEVVTTIGIKGWVYLCLVLLQVPKCFGLVQIFCARPKMYLHIVAVANILCQTKRWFAFGKIGFCAGTKVFEKALNAVKFLGCLKKFWLTQNILGPVKGQGISVQSEYVMSLIRHNVHVPVLNLTSHSLKSL